MVMVEGVRMCESEASKDSQAGVACWMHADARAGLCIHQALNKGRAEAASYNTSGGHGRRWNSSVKEVTYEGRVNTNIKLQAVKAGESGVRFVPVMLAKAIANAYAYAPTRSPLPTCREPASMYSSTMETVPAAASV